MATHCLIGYFLCPFAVLPTIASSPVALFSVIFVKLRSKIPTYQASLWLDPIVSQDDTLWSTRVWQFQPNSLRVKYSLVLIFLVLISVFLSLTI